MNLDVLNSFAFESTFNRVYVDDSSELLRVGCEKIDDSRHFPIADVSVTVPPPPPPLPYPLSLLDLFLVLCGPIWCQQIHLTLDIEMRGGERSKMREKFS